MKRLIYLILLSFLLSPYVYGQQRNISAEISLEGRGVHLQRNSGKFYEYNGLQDHLIVEIYLNYNTDRYSTSFKGENIGADDQYYLIKGSKWGDFKYSIHYNEIPHNYSFGAGSFYVNPGSDNLTYNNLNQWISRFDYSIERRDLGGSFELSLNSPFFLKMDINYLDREGLYPIGAPSGVLRTGQTSGSPFGNVVEMPSPIDNSTTNLSLETGYKSKLLFLSLTGSFSSFNNKDEWLTFRNPYITNQSLSETISLPPDNKYWRLGFSGLIKLPLESTFTLTTGYSKLTSEIALLDRIWASSLPGPTYSFITLGLNDRTFDGDISYKNLSMALTSNPIKSLSSKLYFKYLKKDNDSDEITYTYSGRSETNHIFDYKKHNAGLDLGYKFSKNLKAGVGYDYLKIKREREDIPETRDHRFSAYLKYSPFDFLETTIKYQRLNRSAKFESPGVAPNNPAYIENFVRRFDATDNKQDSLRIGIDISPVDILDLSFEYAYKKDNYNETVLGLTSAKRNEFIFDTSYEIKGVKLYGFFDYEISKADQTTRYINPTGIYSFNPFDPPVPNSYNWDVELKNKNYVFGLGFEVPILTNKLIAGAQYDFEKSNGNADFTSQYLTGGLTQDLIDINYYDDYKKHSLSTKIKYNFKDKFNIILGYMFQKFTYNDTQFDGYQYIMPVTGTTNTYLTGAYKDESYKANVIYLKAIYKF